MIRVSLSLLVLAVIAVAAGWVADQPGKVSLLWHGYRIETSIAVLVALVILAAAAAAVGYRLWRAILGGPRSLSRAWRERRRSQGYRALTQGMVAAAAGDPEEARRQARRADVLLDEPPLTMLLSAQAAQLDGDEAAAAKYFAAMLERPETKFLGLRGLIVQATKAGRLAEALEHARAARVLKPKAAWLLGSLHELAVRTGDWREAEATALAAVRAKAIPSSEGQRRRAVARYEQALAAEREGLAADALKYAREAAQLDRRFVPATVAAARLLAAAGKPRRAGKLIAEAWAESPHPDLAKADLALEPSADPLQRVARMQRLAAHRPADPESRFAVAEAALAAKLWGMARHELEALPEALAGPPLPARACRLWASLEEAEHGDLKAAHVWLARAAESPSDPAWVCAQCGAMAPGWRPVCGQCGAYDSLAWRSLSRAATAELMPPGEPGAHSSGREPPGEIGSGQRRMQPAAAGRIEELRPAS